MKLTFHGGAGEVTGANYLLESDPSTGSGQVTRIMIDCGLHQGTHFCEKHNWEPFPYDPKSINAVFLTHAHIDHSGRLPKLIKDGFHGTVYSTPPTRDFANLLLLDSEHMLIEAAERFKLPNLYGVREIEELMANWKGLKYHESVQVGPFKVTLYNAGHILGSTSYLVEGPSTSSGDTKKIVFSGDLGNSPAPIIGPYEMFKEEDEIDYCVIESAYGNRFHDPIPEGAIEDVIEGAVKAGGVLMIPAFAMERTQKLLFEINELVENGRVPRIPIYLDSPLAIKVTEVYKKYPEYFDQETRNLLKSDNMLFDFPGLHKTLTSDESKSINDAPAPKVIIAGSGMSQGGRILHHEKRYLPDPKSTILFVGYQSKGTLGRQILEGAGSVRIHHETVPVRCRKVVIEGYSAHADQKQLLEWLYPMRFSLKKVFTVQGEEEESGALTQKIINDLAIKAEIPELGKTLTI